MKYAIDCEFIDTPTYFALISFAIVSEDGGSLYFEFDDYDHSELTPWLRENVIPNLTGQSVTKRYAVERILGFIGTPAPEFWCYFGAYDWYWFCRLFGGFMQMPQHWPQLFKDLAHFRQNIPNIAGAEHNALNDARSIMAELMRIQPRYSIT